MKNKYIQRKGIWLDSNTGKTYSHKVNSNCTFFDSTAEYECYQIILHWLVTNGYSRKHLELQRQYKLWLPNGKTWKVDFCLKATSGKGRALLRKLSDNVTSTEYLIEFKGIIDKNFYAKITDMLQNRDSNLARVLLISYEPTAFVWENLQNLEVRYKLIYSLDWLKETLRRL